MELNKKLVEWAGFTQNRLVILSVGADKSDGTWNDPRGKDTNDLELPDFTQSLDACFKWLVPKLAQAEVHKCYEDNVFYGYCEQSLPEQPKIICTTASATADTPALALCLAIEKLMEEKKCQKQQ